MIEAANNVKYVTVEAVKIHADGTREPLGIIASSEKKESKIHQVIKALRKKASKESRGK